MLANLPTEIFNNVPMTCWRSIGESYLYCVNTLEEWKAFYQILIQQKLVACDTETTGFRWFKEHEVIGLSSGWKDQHFYVPLRHTESVQAGLPEQQIDINDIEDDLRAFFGDPTKTTIWHNAKFDMHFYQREGIPILCKIHDTRILWHFYDENAPGALKVIASGWKDELGRWHKGIVDGAASVKEKQLSDWRIQESRTRRDLFRKLVMSEADLLSKKIEFQHMKRNDLKKHIATNLLQDHKYAKSGKDDIHYGLIPISLMTEYAALDTYLTYRVYEYCVKNITWTPGLTALYKNEMNLLLALFEAEEHGMRVDRNHLLTTGELLDARIEELTTTIKAELGDINLKSVQQLADALQEKGVKLTKVTESTANLDDEDKKYVLDKKVLEKLKSKHEIVKAILSLREVLKTKSTYVDGILEKINDENVLHCSFNQNVATGRMSSQDPNLQNIPARNKSIRKAFVPWSSEYIYVFADYSQIEVRLTAHYSQDPLLLDAYRKNQDVHTRTFCEMWGLDVAEISEILKDENHPMYKEYSLLRGVAKRINFGIIYGVGAPGLSEQIERPAKYKDLPDEEWVAICQGYIDQYLDKYVGVRQFVSQGKALVARDLQVTNYFGRVRHLPHANITKVTKDRSLKWMEARASRQGVNFLVQGTAADLFKVAVVRIRNILKGKKSKLVNFVHDEVQIYMHKSEMDLLPLIKKAMEDWKFAIDIIAEFSYSETSWGEKKSLHF